jgi:hypothetical protein
VGLGRLGRWIGGFLTAFLYTSMGVLLMLLPWLPSWSENYFSGSSWGWYSIWMNPYFRGAISGVGVLNLSVSFLELLRLMRGGKG